MFMGSPGRAKRIFASLWAVLQFALPMVVLWGDAFSARAALGQERTHIESQASNTCRPVHPDECALCQFMANNCAPLGHAAMAVAVPHATHDLLPETRQPSAFATRGLPTSRGPPAV
jgi:hypothetical protein